ncbi:MULTISPECIES: TetR/AcrR family transcriptional regulator [Nocardia]|uniref:Toluene efflux pump ttgABC operon repressor n=3 Tax=Nocardia farcinica TaxID=37329 RepID=A0A449HDJ0_NOCFR|nr:MULTISPECIES: TetR/AcrR family transcriptional regulator [Nocardia]MBF6139815.1 TetR/AcrR family transcriptional regulator [Nocardia farcinica]MBF6184274.1 TetR/AcrR family transcriptional regulator [Nocardia farcinica]MBF6230709.1 TetR/AcrR family transcriptional regulator [Nocardia farcinica]MBF6256014.1 TetR/AcrR family transcriptional regulator [Nocardia farcinica]MBF6267263.1 TetR/AcrR family transcriptional regulator [Nocardia farcinica]
MKRTSYHHGALRAELMAACLRLIETEGLAAVSLRRVAREAGVSSGAPYHHFPDRAALLAALSIEGFHLLAEELRAARAAAEGTPLDALGALAAAYVRFSRTRPAYFRLMFRPELSQPDKHPEAAAAGDAAFGVLAEAIGDCVAAGQLPADKADTLGITWWAVGHGLASLWLDGQLGKRSAQLGTTAPELTDDVLATLVRLLRPHP